MANKQPPAQDAANHEKNIYIPSFIAAKPFYVGDTESDYLEHQRLKAEPKDTLDKAKWYERGRKLGPAATKYRKGACENCGAMTHKTKECLSRPRKHGAKWTGKDIQADERVEDVSLGWAAKRDRWNGYDARDYDAVVQEYEELETLRQANAKSKTPGEQSGAADDGDATEPGDTAKYTEETDMGRSQPTSTRQLRLREDTAKYLINLDLDSARYDPKTRSMDVEASSLQPTETGEFEGFARPAKSSGDAGAFERAQKYAWETQEGTSNTSRLSAAKKLHLQANPTEGELLLKKKTTEDAERRAAQRKALLDKYGDASLPQSTSSTATSSTIHPAQPTKSKPKQILSSSTYVEYDKYGAPKLAGLTDSVARPQSKYAEDILTNNHTSIWGSFWTDFTWGYMCCHSTVKNSYCTGEAGKTALEESKASNLLLLSNNGDRDDDEGVGEREEVDEEEQGDASSSRQKRKRETESKDRGVTNEEMEVYKRNKMAIDDPMRQFEGLTDRV